MKRLEIPMLVVNLETVQGLRSRIHGLLTMALCILQKGKVFALDSFVFCVVFSHVRCLLSQVTVYGGFITLTYTLQCLRKPDVQFPTNLLQIRQTDAPVHDGFAVRADRCQVSSLSGNRLIIGHVPCRTFRGAASDAVDFTRPTR